MAETVAQAVEGAIPEQGPGGLGGRSTRALSLKALMPLEGLRAVDLGCNAGYNVFDLLDLGCREALGLELRERYLEMAEAEKARLGATAATFRSADARYVDSLGIGKFDLCLCSGLLYHMQNPFNLLKRIRNICRVLALETHVAPPLWAYWLAGHKYRCNLQLRKTTLTLDGEVFSGRENVFPVAQDMKATSGSVVSHRTFWLDVPSLKRALDLAGFELEAFYCGSTPAGKPPVLMDHGWRRLKVFVLARVREPERDIPVVPLESAPVA
jgi:SAM-dependent methyltransferase